MINDDIWDIQADVKLLVKVSWYVLKFILDQNRQQSFLSRPERDSAMELQEKIEASK